ncbi:helix-turn-helix domain-containing protein [Sphingomonas kaistensis]|uniref:helix-turn-helix domain-containing protein n=1 Tax=Sphingomonas kaistensis TaxID=298708 RepID=UPI003CC8819B
MSSSVRHLHILRSKWSRSVRRVTLLKESQAADRLAIAERTLRKIRGEGRISFVLIGRSVRYSLSDLDAFIQSCRGKVARCPSTSRKAARTSTSTSSEMVVAFTARRASRAAEPPSR